MGCGTLSALETAREARELLRACRVLPLAGVKGGPSLVEAITGGPVKGSWWGHPKGKLIYAIAEELGDMQDVLVAKLLAGKLAFIDRALWPALYRVVSDRGWRKRRLDALSDGARALFDELPPRGSARIDQLEIAAGARSKAQRKDLARAKEELEQSFLLRSTSMHTERGRHATVFEPWSRWAPSDVKAAARRLTLERALGEIDGALGGAANPLRER